MREVAVETKKSRVPEITMERLLELSERIKPVVHFNGIGLCYIKLNKNLLVPFLRDYEATERADGLKTLCDITTFHTFGYHIYFNPTVAEVLAQIPEELVRRAVAFQVVSDPTKDVSTHDVEALAAGYHAATTRLYYRE